MIVKILVKFQMYKTVVVVAIHRIGNGVYFYDIKESKINNISQKFLQTSISLDI